MAEASPKAALRPFEELVIEHGPVVMRVCRALVGPADADDAWSETFLSAMRAYPRLAPDSNVSGWLVTIAHHRSIDLLRARARAPQPSQRIPDTPGIDRPPVDEDLLAALDALPAKQRQAVIFRYLADMSYADVGELLECSQPAARRNAADGIAALRKHYGKGNPK
jgi:RNA polymerase sigma factor (sigma-70 family)